MQPNADVHGLAHVSLGGRWRAALDRSHQRHPCTSTLSHPRGFKALKQLVKLYYRLKKYDKMMDSYR